MNDEQKSFRFEEVSDELPPPGYYSATIVRAGFRTSANDNRMLQVVHRLDDVTTADDEVVDYFVLEGVSRRGLRTAQRKLLQLCRACGWNPQKGDEIAPRKLLHARVELWVEHHEWESQPRLRVVGYRPLRSRS